MGPHLTDQESPPLQTGRAVAGELGVTIMAIAVLVTMVTWGAVTGEVMAATVLGSKNGIWSFRIPRTTPENYKIVLF